jgi:hypothetical protein
MPHKWNLTRKGTGSEWSRYKCDNCSCVVGFPRQPPDNMALLTKPNDNMEPPRWRTCDEIITDLIHEV